MKKHGRYWFIIIIVAVVIAAVLLWTFWPAKSNPTRVGDFIIKGLPESTPVKLQDEIIVMFVGSNCTVTIQQHAEGSDMNGNESDWDIYETIDRRMLAETVSFGYNNITLFGKSAGKTYLKVQEQGKNWGLPYTTESVREVYVIPVQMELLFKSGTIYAGEKVRFQYSFKPDCQWTQEGLEYDANGVHYVIPSDQFTQEDFERLWMQTTENLLNMGVQFESLLPIDVQTSTAFTEEPGKYNVSAYVEGTDIAANVILEVN